MMGLRWVVGLLVLFSLLVILIRKRR